MEEMSYISNVTTITDLTGSIMKQHWALPLLLQITLDIGGCLAAHW
jgi:hypothetical protein